MKIGVLGAGQLGRMLALAGLPLGLEFLFLDPAEEACAASLAPRIKADYLDPAALEKFCAEIDIATFEFENVPLQAAEFIAARRPLRPGVAALAASQDRLSEKRMFESLGIPVAPYAAVDDEASLHAAVARIGLPAVLKTRRFGYDGKGQAILRTPADVVEAWRSFSRNALILEGFIKFDREVSGIGVRGADGQTAFYPATENLHRKGILYASRPLRDDCGLQAKVEAVLRRVLDHLDYCGVLAFEFFVCGEQLIANEMAPRVHNSGHWTIDGAGCSQFENHLRAICGLPLGVTAARGESLMLNCVGTAPDIQSMLTISGAHLHLYGKQPKPFRKIGHVTLTGDSPAQVDQLRLLAEPLIAGW